MRTAADNPFTPGSDHLPQIWAGRVPELTDWEAVVRPRRVAGIYERGRTYLGEAGLGKSTLVRRIAVMAQNHGDIVSSQIRIPAGGDPLKAVAREILKLADQAGLSASRDKAVKELLERVRSVSIKGISLTLDRAEGPEPYIVLTELLVKLGEISAQQNRVLLLHIDEVQNIANESALSQLLVALGDAVVHENTIHAPGGYEISRVLPIAVYLTGLPEFFDMTGARKGATFVRRFKTTTLESISDSDLLLALDQFIEPGWPVSDNSGELQYIRMTPKAAAQLAALCHGEPFLFQLAGEAAWYQGNGNVITDAEVIRGWNLVSQEAAAHVERILERLPSREREILDAMAALPADERTATAIAQKIGLADATKLGQSAQRLDTARGIISRGKPYTFRHRAIEAYLTSDWPSVI